MKSITLTLVLALFSIGLFSQEFEVPKNYKLDKAEDYALYEQDIIKCVDWLMKTPLNEQKAKRKEANAFLLKWLTGSPNVTIEIKPEIVTFMGTSPDLLILFMGGWAKYALESKDFKNKIAGSMAGIEAVIEFYTKNKAFLKKDKNVEKYAKMKNKGTLKAYIEKKA
jgi:hypothetical protein